MRRFVAIAVLLLVAGCAGDQQRPTSSTSAAAAPTSTDPSANPSRTPTGTSRTPPAPTTPPAAGAPVAAVIAWVQAGTQADLAGFHNATLDGATTDLGEGVAFVTPSGKTQCRADATMTDGALACLVDFADPPAQPADVYGQWIDKWVDFDGASAQVGSVHGDPGPFTVGTGAELPYGSTLRFGDYQCRTDPVALFCVNFARQTALQMSDAGVAAFGCLQQVPQPADAGVRYECS
jgi:hypothetical protein